MFDATPLLKTFARGRLARLRRMDPVKMQEHQLLKLVRQAQDTRFGRHHGFHRIKDVRGFQVRVPLWHYESMWDQYWKDHFPVLTDCSWPGTIPYFAETSGTTAGTTKYIPCTVAMNRSNRRAAMDIMCHHIAAKPHSRVFAGKTFMLGGSTALKEPAPGVRIGDLSGIAVSSMPGWARPYSFPPEELALLDDWEEKIDVLARRSLDEPIRVVSGVPSWLLILFDKVMALRRSRGEPEKPVYPDLDLLVHGGVNFSPYRRHVEDVVENGKADIREVYPASEGFFAVEDRGPGEGLRLMVDSGIFYEFVPTEQLNAEVPARHWLNSVEMGVDYAIVVSTCAGLWSYVVGDTVRFVERDPPRLLVTGRTSYTLSAFGEHLIGEEIEQAVTAAAAEIGLDLRDFSVGPVFPERPEDRGGHIYVVEFDGQEPEAAAARHFATTIDRTLKQLNDDYRTHRSEGFGLRGPAVRVVSSGTFTAWMKSRGRLGGQHKVPRVLTKADLLADLLSFTKGASVREVDAS